MVIKKNAIVISINDFFILPLYLLKSKRSVIFTIFSQQIIGS